MKDLRIVALACNVNVDVTKSVSVVEAAIVVVAVIVVPFFVKKLVCVSGKEAQKNIKIVSLFCYGLDRKKKK